MKERSVLCLEKRYANFIYGKVYAARARAFKGLGAFRQPTDYYITDEDGDYYTISETENQLKDKWQWIDEGGVRP